MYQHQIITLLFAQSAYEKVAEAFLSASKPALQRARTSATLPALHFFVSRNRYVS